MENLHVDKFYQYKFNLYNLLETAELDINPNEIIC